MAFIKRKLGIFSQTYMTMWHMCTVKKICALNLQDIQQADKNTNTNKFRILIQYANTVLHLTYHFLRTHNIILF